MGAHDLSKMDDTEQIMKVRRTCVHVKFGKDKFNHNDIALIELENDVTFNNNVRPICLPSDDLKQFPTGTQCVATGWGTLGIERNN